MYWYFRVFVNVASITLIHIHISSTSHIPFSWIQLQVWPLLSEVLLASLISVCSVAHISFAHIFTLRQFLFCYPWACGANWRGQRPCSILILHLPKCLASSPANSRHSINTCWSIWERQEWSISNSKHHLGARWLNRWILQPFFNATKAAFAPQPRDSDLGALLAGQFLDGFPGSTVLRATLWWPGHPSDDLLTAGYSLFSLLLLLKSDNNNNNKNSGKPLSLGPLFPSLPI